MSLTDDQVQKQIRHMTAFIDQEANEKVEEIDAKAEEEFQIEKSRLVQDQRVKIMEYYTKKEKQIELAKKIQNSNMMNQARLKILQNRQQHIQAILEEGRNRLSKITEDQGRYKTTLEGLIAQGLYQLLEKDMLVRCRQQDVNLVNEAVRGAKDKYEKATGKAANIVVDTQNFLPANVSGGVEVLARGGKIRVVNTLDSRLDQISHKMVPEIREILFGVNPNRRFTD